MSCASAPCEDLATRHVFGLGIQELQAQVVPQESQPEDMIGVKGDPTTRVNADAASPKHEIWESGLSSLPGGGIPLPVDIQSHAAP